MLRSYNIFNYFYQVADNTILFNNKAIIQMMKVKNDLLSNVTDASLRINVKTFYSLSYHFGSWD